MATLAGCDQPTPSVTVFSGTHSDHREAICWSADADEAVDLKSDCSITLQSTEDFNERLLDIVAIIPTSPGDTVGISVDPAVADHGWQVSINGRSLTRDPVTENYFRFAMPAEAMRKGDAQLIVQALTSDGTAVRGSWIFGLSDN
jgi:hypothetical protein